MFQCYLCNCVRTQSTAKIQIIFLFATNQLKRLIFIDGIENLCSIPVSHQQLPGTGKMDIVRIGSVAFTGNATAVRDDFCGMVNSLIDPGSIGIIAADFPYDKRDIPGTQIFPEIRRKNLEAVSIIPGFCRKRRRIGFSAFICRL